MEFRKAQQNLLQAKKQRQETDLKLFKAREKLGRIRRDKENLIRFARKGQRTIKARLRELEKNEKKANKTIDELSVLLHEHKQKEAVCFKLFFQFTDPTTGLSNLDDRFPILLFPLRIETRFKKFDPSFFHAEEFREPYSVKGLCQKIAQDLPELFSGEDTHSVRWLNKALELDIIYRKLPDKCDEREVPAEVREAIDRYESTQSKRDLRILNRCLLEMFYPDITPKYNQLWVRVFPDEIAVDTFEEVLSENEVRNARTYWSFMWRAGEIDDDQRAAWRALVSNHGSGRAYWIIQNYTPVNTEDRPTRTEIKKINLIISTDDPPEQEVKDALKTYWTDMWYAQDDTDKQADAWDKLADVVGEDQIGELLKSYTPVNFDDTPPEELTYEDMEIEVAFICFPTQDEIETKFQSWTKAPKVHVLPERFVLLGFMNDNDKPEIEVVGNPVPSTLAAGPDPSAEEGSQFRISEKDQEIDGRFYRKGDLIVGSELRWLVDFDEAVRSGMGFNIGLNPRLAEKGFDRLFVLGVRLSTDKDEGGKAIETLIDHHHHSRKGIAIISQGTPTNNTEQESSDYSWKEDSDKSFDIYFKNEYPDDPSGWFEKKDGRWLAEILGIDPVYLQKIANYYGTDQLEARAMNIALWPATLGYFMETMMAPVFSDKDINQVRMFFQQYVSGRGMIPAIRVGRQPYGILAATPFSRMKWLNVLTPFTHPMVMTDFIGISASSLQRIYWVLRKIDRDWTELLEKVSHVGKDGDAHQILLDIVGLNPSSVEYYYRYAESFIHLFNTLNLHGMSIPDLQQIIEEYVLSGLQLLAKFNVTIQGDEDVPDILEKFFFRRSDMLKGPFIDDVPLSESKPIRAYARQGKKEINYIQWLINAAEVSHNALRMQQGFIDNKPPSALLYLMLHHALDLGYIDASLRLHYTARVLKEEQIRAARLEPKFIHVQDIEDDAGSRWQYLYKTERDITGDETTMVGSYIPTLFRVQKNDDTKTLRNQLQSLERLKDAPTARLERVFAEHLDTCSYRFEAWMFGLVNAQLSLMRGIRGTVNGVPATKGIYIGAYGWLEEVRSEAKELVPADIDEDLQMNFSDPEHPLMIDNTNDGYIHAPSINHAVTAAVLRNGYLANPPNLAVNLSSERVRHALSIIDGIRSGQSLAALLGYKLERGLHDRHEQRLDEFIFDLRKAFPLVANRMSTTKEPAEDTDEELAIEQIEARNVIDGLALVEHIKETGENTYPFGLDDLPDASPNQKVAINEEVARIIDINDAVADLAIAEGVHQVAQGNFDRAAATMDAYSKGGLPPIPDVIRTPRSGMVLTHRVVLQLETSVVPPANATPRATAEPAVNKWLSDILPKMKDVVCIAEYFDDSEGITLSEIISMKDLGLQPIDVLSMVHLEDKKAMTALDDIILIYVIDSFAPGPDAEIRIMYLPRTETTEKLSSLPEGIEFPDVVKDRIRYDEANKLLIYKGIMSSDDRISLRQLSNDESYRKVIVSLYDRSQPLDEDKVTLFELAPLLNSLCALVQRSRPLTPADVMLPSEASKASEADVSMDPDRIASVRNLLFNPELPNSPSLLVRVKDFINRIMPNIERWIRKSAFGNNDLVPLLEDAKILEKIEDSPDYVRFDDSIKTEEELRELLAQIEPPIDPIHIEKVVTIWQDRLDEKWDYIIRKIDDDIKEITALYMELILFGLPQTGIGFLLEWKRKHFELLCEKVEEMIERWDEKLDEADMLIDEYDELPDDATDEERFALLQKAECLVSTTSTIPLPDTPEEYKNDVVEVKRDEFEVKLAAVENIVLDSSTLSGLYKAVLDEMQDIPLYDLVGLDIEKDKKQLVVFAEDMLQGVKNLYTDVNERLLRVNECLQTFNGEPASTPDEVAALLDAGKELLGEDFRIVSEFHLTEDHVAELQNAYDERDTLLEYQKEKLGDKLPVDTWLYGIARVREKMRHFENVTVLVDAMGRKEVKLEPIQLPYHEDDSWLALEYPRNRGIAKSQFGDDTMVQTLLDEGIVSEVEDDPERVRFDDSIETEEALRERLEGLDISDAVVAIWRRVRFGVDEEKLLYTAYFTASADIAQIQCGLLIDEWTEVIPTEEETTGITFHYDRPNSEPPQVLLLVTPSNFEQSWQWQDLVDALHETLDMAKKRAVEPDHIDTTGYARFLPALVSATTALPITAALRLAMNNEYYLEKPV